MVPNNALGRHQVLRRLTTLIRELGLSEKHIQDEIDSVRGRIDRSILRKHLISHDTIGRFLRTGGISYSRLRILDTYLSIKEKTIGNYSADPIDFGDKFFEGLIEYFGVNENRIDEGKSTLSGTYEFFARSEERTRPGRRYIVRGALRLESDPNSNALKVTELQGLRRANENDSATRIVDQEIWEGFFFVRQGRVIIVLRNHELIPKFYILEKRDFSLSRENPSINILHGMMVKVGSGGGVFHSPIYMRRKRDAFNNCDVVLDFIMNETPAKRIDANILEYLE